MKRLLSCLVFLFFAASAGYAAPEQLTVVFTGRTHGMIYPCRCPIEPAGGVSRRATVIKELRKKRPLVLLDAGDIFAGGPMDPYSQGKELDTARSLVNLSAMEIMGYDCVAVGESEFNFGREFFEKTARGSKVPFIACNLASDAVKPYIIDTSVSPAVGITAVVAPSLANRTEGLAIAAPVEALSRTIKEMKAKGAGLIILLSNLGEKDDMELGKAVQGIDILVINKTINDLIPQAEGPVLYLKTHWQAKRLGKAELMLKDGVIEKMAISEEPLAAAVPDEPKVAAAVPHCFDDVECAKPGKWGTCLNKGQTAAQCRFENASKVPLTIIFPDSCTTCDWQTTGRALKSRIPGLDVSLVHYPGAEAEALIKKMGIKTLPAFLVGKQVEKEKSFDQIKSGLDEAGEYYMVKPEMAGFGYFLDRPVMPGKLDVFISIFMPGADKLLESLKEFRPQIHFLVFTEKDGSFSAEKGAPEVEEALRSVCVSKAFPGFYYDYLICRARDPSSTWWDKCLDGPDLSVVRKLALGEDGTELLKENISLGAELNVHRGPTYLLDNREIFSSVSVPSKEDLRKIIIRK